MLRNTGKSTQSLGSAWHKSTFSGTSGCVEARQHLFKLVELRDSKDPDGPTLGFDVKAWKQFVAFVASEQSPLRDTGATS